MADTGSGPQRPAEPVAGGVAGGTSAAVSASAATPSPARWGRYWLALALPAGFALGVVGGFLQQLRLDVGAVSVPWATALLVATLVAAIRALSLNVATKLAGGAFYAGWLIATALLALPNPSGDAIFTDDLGSLAYLLAGSVVGAGAAAWPLLLDPATLPRSVVDAAPTGPAPHDGPEESPRG